MVLCWLSTDPLAEKYSSVSPYVYCLQNPILYVDPDGRDVVAWLVQHMRVGNKLTPISNRNILTGASASTMRDIMKTKVGSNYISQFMKKGDEFYGYKAEKEGKYSNVVLNITEYSLQGEDKRLYGTLGFAERDGVTNVNDVDGVLTINIFFRGIATENLTHELFVHNAGQIDDIVNTYKNKGIDAVNAMLNSADLDHKALKTLDAKHEGTKMYMNMFQDLLNVAPTKYKSIYKEINLINQKKYEKLK